ncbi:MAG: hypothetical protein JKY88_18375 [Pseudomonadales bacterium]|nr:hypothetical protein [Pseudomonadales bacterium]
MNFEHEKIPEWLPTPQQAFFASVDLAMFCLLYAILSENIAGLSDFYISELPFIGSLFETIAPEATPAHITAALLSFMIIAVPLYIWSYVLKEEIIQNYEEWFAQPQNQIIACVAGGVLLLVASIEGLNLFTLIAKQSAGTDVFVQAQVNDFMSILANNKALAIACSASLTVLNILIALLTANAFINKP